MKRILLPAALAITLCGSFALAQQPQQTDQQPPAPIERHHHANHAPDPHKAAMRMSKELNLSADQTAKVEPILADRVSKMNALQSNADLTPKDRKKQFHAIRRDSEQQLAAILTPDQLQQLKSMHHHGHRGQNQPPPAA